MGRHETDLFLERREPVPALGEPERLLWWVNAYDQVRPGTHGKAKCPDTVNQCAVIPGSDAPDLRFKTLGDQRLSFSPLVH